LWIAFEQFFHFRCHFTPLVVDWFRSS
jgi:hypothetical protein